MVQGITTTGSSINSLLSSAPRANEQKKAETTGRTEDMVSIGEQKIQTAATYGRSLITGIVENNGGTDFKELVSRLLSRQGVTWQAAMAGETVEIDEETRAEARALIADDGYWGVEQTSARIFELAVANAGEDLQKLDQIKAAVEKGFEMAREALGGTLPQISLDTYDAVMEKLDSWANIDNA